jgi:DNA invertase Pin-like site-specific DNA recombinase
MRLHAYLRVSSAGQIDAWGLDRQEAAIKQYAKTHGHRIVRWFRDEGVSATVEAVDRPQLAEAIRTLGPKVDGLLVADLDRFARSLTVQEAAPVVIWRAGGKVLTATSGEVHTDDPDDASRTLIRQVMGAVIEFEKRQAVKRMRDGMLAKARTGRKATGSYAFGYRGQGKGRNRDAAPDPDEQDTLDVIMDLRGMSASYRTIVDVLNRDGHKPKRARKWSPMTVKRIYDRETKQATPPAADTLVTTLMGGPG